MRKLIAAFISLCLILPNGAVFATPAVHLSSGARPIGNFADCALTLPVIFEMNPLQKTVWIRCQAAVLLGFSLAVAASPAFPFAMGAPTHQKAPARKTAGSAAKAAQEKVAVHANAVSLYKQSIGSFKGAVLQAVDVFHDKVGFTLDDDLPRRVRDQIARVWVLTALADPALSRANTPAWLQDANRSLVAVQKSEAGMTAALHDAQAGIDRLPQKGKLHVTLTASLEENALQGAIAEQDLKTFRAWTLTPGAPAQLIWRSPDLIEKASYQTGGEGTIDQYRLVSRKSSMEVECGIQERPKEYHLGIPKGDTLVSDPYLYMLPLAFTNDEEANDYIAGKTQRDGKLFSLEKAVAELFGPSAAAASSVTPASGDTLKSEEEVVSFITRQPAGQTLIRDAGFDGAYTVADILWTTWTQGQVSTQHRVTTSQMETTLQLAQLAQPVVLRLLPSGSSLPAVRESVTEESLRRAAEAIRDSAAMSRTILEMARSISAESLSKRYAEAQTHPKSRETPTTLTVRVFFEALKDHLDGKSALRRVDGNLPSIHMPSHVRLELDSA